MRSTFIGQFLHGIDPKNRLFIPPRFRDALQKERKSHFILTAGFEGCLWLFLPSDWEQILSGLSQLKLANKDQERTFKRLFLAKATEVEVDGQGRILVPLLLKEEGGLKKEVFINGAGNKVELWDRGRWEAYERKSKKLLASASKDLEL